MIAGFQKYLIDKGFKRTKNSPFTNEIVEDYESLFLSSYGPLFYTLTDGVNVCTWELAEYGKPPVLNLGFKKISVADSGGKARTHEDGYRILFSKLDEKYFDWIFNVFISRNMIFIVNCMDEKNITISANRLVDGIIYRVEPSTNK